MFSRPGLDVLSFVLLTNYFTRYGQDRRHHCLPPFFLLFKFVTSETTEYFVVSTNALLVSILIQMGDFSSSNGEWSFMCDAYDECV